MNLRNNFVVIFGISALLFVTNELFCPLDSLKNLPFRSPFGPSFKSSKLKRFLGRKVSIPNLPEISPSHMEIYYGDKGFSKIEQAIPQEIRPKIEIGQDVLSVVGSAKRSIEIIYDGEMDPKLAELLLCQAEKNIEITLFMHRRVFCSDINYQRDPIFIKLNKHKNVEIMLFGNFLDDDLHSEMVMTYDNFVFSVDSNLFVVLAKKIRKLSAELAQPYFQYLRKNSLPIAEAPYLWPTTQ